VNPTPPLDLLLELVERHAEPTGRDWFRRAASRVDAASDATALLDAVAAASRSLGKAAVEPAEADRTRLRMRGLEWAVAGRGLDEIGRLALLVLASRRLPADACVGMIERGYDDGDNRERQAILRALSLLPDPERFVAVGVEACRSHVQPIFEAMACENPYPAAYFPELNFNQMVLKALFIGVALDRLIGLDGRVTPELCRMAEDYASERRAASRSVPTDIRRLTAGEWSQR
jgi:hypothetical protein